MIKREGYERITGAEGQEFPEVPGVGPVLSVFNFDGKTYASRNDGSKAVTYRASPTRWVKVE